MRHSKHWQMNVTPDVLVIPSKLTCLAKEVFGTLVLNPGQLAKGVRGGTFAEITVHPSVRQGDSADEETGGTEGEESHEVCSRALVEIRRI